MSFGSIQAEKMTTESGYSLGAGNASSFKNRFINGNMAIDQRTSGAVSTPVNNTYPSVDRYKYYLGAASKCTTQQLTASPPANFTSYLNITSTSAYTVGASEGFFITQIIEGFNVSDLGWGTANAKPITLSFWVQSSLTGTFGGAVVNYGQTTNWTFAYTITAANTWQQVSVTLTGPTTGSWSLGTNSPSMYVAFSFAAGSSAQGAASTSWATVGAGVFAPTGQVNLLGTNGATWNITGIQFEVGTVATSFDFRSITQETALCQRYFNMIAKYGVTGSGASSASELGGGWFYNSGQASWITHFATQMRIAPSLYYGGTSTFYFNNGGQNITTLNIDVNSINNCTIYSTNPSGTAGVAGVLRVNNSGAYIGFSAEL